MKKVFRAKRRRKIKLIVLLFYVLAILLLINMISSKFSSAFLLDYDMNNLIDFKIDRENVLLKLGLNRTLSKNKVEYSPVFKEINYKPKIYIYNTHQSEEYADGNVLMASNYLKEYLSDKFDVIVENYNIISEIKNNNLEYKDSYKISRRLLNKYINEDYSLYIDLHRDDASDVVEFDNKRYAKLMFVIGAKHETYKNNYSISDDINKYVLNINDKLSKNIFIRKSSSYNQDLKPNVLLIEVGGVKNTMEEVNNTLKVLSDAIKYYILE